MTAASLRHPVRALVVATIVATIVAAIVGIATGAVTPLRALFAPMVSSFLVVGVILVERRPGNIVGPLVLWLGLLIAAFGCLDVWARLPWQQPAVDAAAITVSLLDGPMLALIAMLFLVFPDGRLPTPRWRILVVVTLVLAVVVVGGALFRPGALPYYPWIANPLSPPPNPLSDWWEVSYGLLVGCVAVAALSLVVRWRRADLVQRAQLKWAAGAAALVAIAMITYQVSSGPSRPSEVGDLSVGVALCLFPIAIAVAVLRYRLYEIDRIVSRTISYALVTGILALVFVAVILVLQTALQPFTQGQTIAVAASTLAVFALFQPVRRRVQRTIDRRFDRARYDAERTALAFSERLRDVVDTETVTTDLARTAGATVAPTRLGIWLRPREANR